MESRVEHENILEIAGDVGLVDYNDNLQAATTQRVKVQVAMDSGAVVHVDNPEELPCNVAPEPNTSGRRFVDAQAGQIKKYGHGNR